MRFADYHEAWEMKPRKLTIEELEHPEKVLEDFFQFIHLPQARWYMKEWMRTLVTDSFTDLNKKDKQSMIFFHDQLEKLIEGIYVIYEKDYCRPLSQSDRKNDVCTRLEQIPADHQDFD